MKGSNQYTEIDNQLYAVPKGKAVTFIPAAKEDKKQRLKAIIFNLLRKRWYELPKERATLERTAIKELINSLALIPFLFLTL